MKVLFNEDSEKHWSVDRQGSQLEIVYWYEDRSPQTMVKKYDSDKEAEKAEKKYVSDRLKKGYIIEGDDSKSSGTKKKKSANIPKKAYDAIRKSDNEAFREAIEAGLTANDCYKDESIFDYTISAALSGNLEPLKMICPTITSYIEPDGNDTESKFNIEHHISFSFKLMPTSGEIIKTAIEAGFDLKKDPFVYETLGMIQDLNILDYIYSIIPLNEDKGQSMLSAITYKNAPMVKYLIDNKASLDGMDYRSGVFVMGAAIDRFSDDLDTIKLLVEAGADTNKKSIGNLDWYDASLPRTNGGIAPLEQILSYQDNRYGAKYNEEIKKYMLQHAELVINEEEALQAAFKARFAALRAYFPKNGTTARDSKGRGLLHYALMKGQSTDIDRIIALLVENGIDVNAVDNDGRNALFCINVGTYYAGEKNIAEILVNHGIDINRKDNYGLTPIMFHAIYRPDQPTEISEKESIYTGRSSALNCLTKAGADLNVKFPDDGKTIFHHLIVQQTYFCDNEILERMIEKGGDVNIKDNRGRTGLHYATTHEYNTSSLDNIKVYVEKGKADINLQDNDGNTPLHVLIIEGDKNSVSQFLRMGAKTDIKNNDGKTAIDLMKEFEVFEKYNSYLK